MVNRNENQANDDHRNRQSKIKLHKTHSVVKSLSGRRKKRNRARLSRHHRQSDREPSRIISFEKILYIFLSARFPSSINDDEKHRSNQNQPINSLHFIKISLTNKTR